jgi:hypothetical protein
MCRRSSISISLPSGGSIAGPRLLTATMGPRQSCCFPGLVAMIAEMLLLDAEPSMRNVSRWYTLSVFERFLFNMAFLPMTSASSRPRLESNSGRRYRPSSSSCNFHGTQIISGRSRSTGKRQARKCWSLGRFERRKVE